MLFKHIVTCVAFADTPTVPIGFYALLTVVEEARKLPGRRYLPSFGNPDFFACLRLVYIAVQQDLQGYGIGLAMMGKVISDFANVGEVIGIPLLILTPLGERARTFYDRLGFQSQRRGNDMYLSLESAIQARDDVPLA